MMKEPEALSLPRHVLGWWIGTPVLTALVFAGGARVLDAPDDQVNTLIMLSIVFGLATGWLFGIIAFFVNKGLHGWAHLARTARDNYAQGQRKAQVEAALDQQAAEQGTPEDTWEPEYAFTQEVGHDQEYAPGQEYTSATAPGDSDDPWRGKNQYGCCQDNYDDSGVLHHGSADCRHPVVLDTRDREFQQARQELGG